MRSLFPCILQIPHFSFYIVCLIRKAGVRRDIHLFFTEFGREFSEKHIGPVFDMENATFESMEPSECEQLLSLTRKYVQILKKNMKQYVLEEKEF